MASIRLRSKRRSRRRPIVEVHSKLMDFRDKPAVRTVARRCCQLQKATIRSSTQPLDVPPIR